MDCYYCVNQPKKAAFLIGDKPVCKSCINSTILQTHFKAQSIEPLQTKNVNRYNLPLDRKYTLIGFDFHGSLVNGGGSTCENCSQLIVNSATLKDNLGHEWVVGLDCAQTLSLTDTSDFWKVKEQEAKTRKYSAIARAIRKLKIEGRLSVAHEDKSVLIYDKPTAVGLPIYRISQNLFDQYFSKAI